MFEQYFKDKMAPLALRLALGASGVYHGFLKIMASGGISWAPGMPTGWQVSAAWGEFVAAIAILLGWRCRWGAATLLLVNSGYLLWWQGWNLAHLPIRQLEPLVLFLFMGVTLLFLGAGDVSLDGKTTQSFSSPKPMKKKNAA